MKQKYYKELNSKVREVKINDTLYIEQRTFFSCGLLKSLGFYKDGLLHFEDGPAYTGYSLKGNVVREEWWQNDEPHRTNGPAIINYTPKGRIRSCNWYIKGNNIDEKIKTWLVENNIRSWTTLTKHQQILLQIQILNSL